MNQTLGLQIAHPLSHGFSGPQLPRLSPWTCPRISSVYTLFSPRALSVFFWLSFRACHSVSLIALIDLSCNHRSSYTRVPTLTLRHRPYPIVFSPQSQSSESQHWISCLYSGPVPDPFAVSASTCSATEVTASREGVQYQSRQTCQWDRQCRLPPDFQTERQERPRSIHVVIKC